MSLEGIHFSGIEKIEFQHLFLNIKDTFTYEFWVNPNAKIRIPSESTSRVSGHKGQSWVIGAGHGGMGDRAGIGVSVGTNGIAVFEHCHNYFPATLVYSSPITEWTHIGIVYENKTPSLYINGIFIRKGLVSEKEHVYPSGLIGVLEPYGHFIGRLDEIRIWDYARSKEEIFTFKDKELLGNEPGLFVNLKERKGNVEKSGKMFNVTTSKLEFPTNHSPLVSIIIPVFNKWEYTYACIKSIYENTDGLNYEVILADDMSSDETKEIDTYFSNVTVIRDGINKGFIKNCNNAASYANGKYLLFLNNDTEVQKDWLKYLVQTIESEKNIGMVGAKLIYPNGQLQEAGSIIFNEGSCYGYGRGENPDNPEYSYVREVYYCSGACILINRELFNNVKCFDEQFYPAYYEEVDLSMKIRELGYKVMYQPAAKVIHHEFGSSTSNKAIELQKINRGKFYHKWKQQIQSYHSPSIDKVVYSRDMNQFRFKILVVDDRIPAVELGSGFPRTFEILQCLSELGFQVTYFPLQNPVMTEPYTHILQQIGIEVFYNVKREKLNFNDFYKNRKDLYDVIWISRPHNMKEIAEKIKSINSQQKIIYDAEALYSKREILRKGLVKEELSDQAKEKIIKKEIDLINTSDIVVAVSNHEKKMISNHIKKPIIVVGHSIKINATPASFSERKDILFVGGFLSSPSPNEDAIHYFVNEIYPIVNKKLDAKLWIVGTNNAKSIHRLASDQIQVTGTVDNLWEFYNKCKVFIIPTRYAAGIPLKAYEAMAHGIPTIVTPLIANQLEINEDSALIGENANRFAEKIIQCYTGSSVWNKLRVNGLKYVQTEGNKELLKERLMQLKRLVLY